MINDQSGLVHSLATTSAKVHDLRAPEELLHGEEARVWGDAGYREVEMSQRRTGAADGSVQV